ncbi:MAG: hypothetical protein RLZZ301_1783 [Bacteroidota bacterium]|jgi:glyoxylase-like metal-dependent hydrolase (beta-lactamase superfamily II)
MSVRVHAFTFNGFQENTYIVAHADGSAVLIDPGCYSREEQYELLDFVQQEELTLLAVLYTHAHIDHILGAAFVNRSFGCPSYLHPADQQTWQAVESYAHVYGFQAFEAADLPIHSLEDKQQLEFGSLAFQVRHTPGHAPGHVVFYHQDGFVINGDVLFKGSFGRVDLPGGDLETLKKSIYEVLFQFPEQTVVYCGHGPQTTISDEKKFNYILQF